MPFNNDLTRIRIRFIKPIKLNGSSDFFRIRVRDNLGGLTDLRAYIQLRKAQ